MIIIILATYICWTKLTKNAKKLVKVDAQFFFNSKSFHTRKTKKKRWKKKRDLCRGTTVATRHQFPPPCHRFPNWQTTLPVTVRRRTQKKPPRGRPVARGRGGLGFVAITGAGGGGQRAALLGGPPRPPRRAQAAVRAALGGRQHQHRKPPQHRQIPPRVGNKNGGLSP